MSEEREQPHILITTDSVCDLPPELVREYSVKVLPNIVRTRDGQFLDGVEISPDDLLDYMETTDDVVMSDAASNGRCCYVGRCFGRGLSEFFQRKHTRQYRDTSHNNGAVCEQGLR